MWSLTGRPSASDEAQHLHVARELRPADHLAQLVAEERQRPARRDRGILLAQAAGRRVARVDEGLLPRRQRTFVHPLEARPGHVDLAAHLEHVRHDRPRRRDQLVGDVVDRRHVGRDVLADAPVAAGRRLHEPARLEAQAHRQAVDLELAHEPRRQPTEALRHPFGPGPQLGRVHRVVEAHQRDAMGHRVERGADGAAHLAASVTTRRRAPDGRLPGRGARARARRSRRR